MRRKRLLQLYAEELQLLTPTTARSYRREVERFLDWTPKELGKLRRTDVERYLVERACAQRNLLLPLRRLFRLLVAEGVMEEDPTARVRHCPRPRSPRRLLSTDEVQRLLVAASRSSPWPAHALRNRAIVEALYALGLRRREVVDARLGDLSLGEGTLLVRRVKGSTSRVLPVAPSSLSHLEAYLEQARPRLVRAGDSGRLFVSQVGNPMSVSVVGRLLCKVGQLVGVSGVHPHALRRALATHLVASGVNVRAVQLFLGHAGLAATQLYLEVERASLRETVALLDRSEEGQAARARKVSRRRGTPRSHLPGMRRRRGARGSRRRRGR